MPPLAVLLGTVRSLVCIALHDDDEVRRRKLDII